MYFIMNEHAEHDEFIMMNDCLFYELVSELLCSCWMLIDDQVEVY